MVAKLDGTNGLIQQYDYQAPTTGFSYTFAAGTQVLVMNPAGTLATGTITMPASPADGMTITFSSTQAITALTVNANTGQSIVGKPTSFGVGSAATFVYRLSNTTWYPTSAYANSAIPKAALPTGSVLQVVSASTTTNTSTTSSSFVAVTNLTASITPLFTTSKILILVNMNIYGSSVNSEAVATIYRAGSDLTSGNGFADVYAGSTDIIQQAPMIYLDSPATTSSTTYAVYFKRTQGIGTIQSSLRGTTNTITLMEIAA